MAASPPSYALDVSVISLNKVFTVRSAKRFNILWLLAMAVVFIIQCSSFARRGAFGNPAFKVLFVVWGASLGLLAISVLQKLRQPLKIRIDDKRIGFWRARGFRFRPHWETVTDLREDQIEFHLFASDEKISIRKNCLDKELIEILQNQNANKQE